MAEPIECCCGRLLVKDALGGWDHADGEGVMCWPDSHDADASYRAEPAIPQPIETEERDD